jgi:UDP:flavonoid glycosyltransferase YjiC (YdhE family)
VTGVLGLTLSQALFNLVSPLVFAYHTLPLNRVRRDYGLPSLGYDLREIYTHADQTLYADIPNLVPTASLPSHHHWLGPILWSPAVALPPWWLALPEYKPIVYVTLGSSGESDGLLPIILQGLKDLPITVIAATAGHSLPTHLPANVWIAAFLPGTEAAGRSTLVICNGGSLATQQALAVGVPVIGIADNMDQHLNMLCLERVGAGLRLRAGQLTAKRLQTAAEQLLYDKAYKERAGKVMQSMRNHNTRQVFPKRVAAQIG